MVPKDLIPTRLIEPFERKKIKSSQKKRGSWSAFFLISKAMLACGFLYLLGKRTSKKRKAIAFQCLHNLGMLWIRLAQMLVLQTRWLATEFGRELIDLKVQGEAYPFPVIRTIVEEELNQPLEDVFVTFEESPFTGSNVSQTHRAFLKKDNCPVAVKIQNPSALDVFQKDLKFISKLIRILKFFSIYQGLRWDDLFHELKEIGNQELNYQYESNAIVELSKNLAGQKMFVPKVFPEYGGKRVLCMEFIQGALLSDVITLKNDDPARLEKWLKANHINLKTIALRLFHTVYRQVFEDNFFHCDLNTANIILLKNSHIAIIECRNASSLERETLTKQKLFYKYLSTGDLVTAAEIFFLFASRLPRVDLATVKERLIQIWRKWEMRAYVEVIAYNQKSVSGMMGQANKILAGSHFSAVWSLSKLLGTWVNLDNAIQVLDSTFNPIFQMRSYFKTAENRENVALLRNLPQRLGASLTALHEFPEKMEEFELLREALLRRQAQVVQGSSQKVDFAIASFFSFGTWLCFLASLLLGLNILRQGENSPIHALLGDQLLDTLSFLSLWGSQASLSLFLLSLILTAFFFTQRRRFSKKVHTKGQGPMSLNI